MSILFIDIGTENIHIASSAAGGKNIGYMPAQ